MKYLFLETAVWFSFLLVEIAEKKTVGPFVIILSESMWFVFWKPEAWDKEKNAGF